MRGGRVPGRGDIAQIRSVPLTSGEMRILFRVWALVVIMASLSFAQTVGPQLGERIPDFQAVDQHGRSETFESLTGKNGLLLLFYRSADW